LYGKLVNCCADLPSDHLKAATVFKQLTGGDTVTGERKYQDSFDFTPYVRLLFSANHPPQSNDASKAFFDRWLVVPFDRSFRGTRSEVPREKMDAALADPRELSGVLNKALPALRSLRAAGRFTESKSMRRAFGEFQEATDPLGLWLEANTVTLPHVMVQCGDLLRAYNADCHRRNRPPMNQTNFGMALRRLRPNVEVRKRGPRGAQKDYYIGIGLKAQPEIAEERANVATSVG
jgi:putative DNA primase/helicase